MELSQSPSRRSARLNISLLQPCECLRQLFVFKPFRQLLDCRHRSKMNHLALGSGTISRVEEQAIHPRRIEEIKALDRAGAQHAAQESAGHLRVATRHVEQRADSRWHLERAETRHG